MATAVSNALNAFASLAADLNAPPDQVPKHPPTSTRVQALPLGDLTWENFERLCYRLAGKTERVEYVARYGRSGQAQQGIDIFARLTNGKYEVWQAKRYSSITPRDIKRIVNAFRSGTWKPKSEQLVIAVQASLSDTNLQNEIETQAQALRAEGITLVPRGGQELSEILRHYPEIVDDFFGRAWVEAFLGDSAAKAFRDRLDGGEFARVRAQLGRYYHAQFHLLDIGVSLPLSMESSSQSAPPSLLRRFAVPDVLVRELVIEEPRAPRDDEVGRQQGTSGDARSESRSNTRRRDYVRRTSLTNWLSDGFQLAVIGEAGSGKSTLLRCIALDLLGGQSTFSQIAGRWGALLPIHISFSRWSRLSASLGRAGGLKEVVADTLQPALTGDLLSLLDRAIDERRILLLLDGLDEWSDEQAARTTLQHILAFVATHNIPIIVTARPRGLDKIGAVPPGWRIAELAPLSMDQQRQLAAVWFARVLAAPDRSETDTEIWAPIEARLDRFFAEIGRDPRLSALAGNPLLLVGLIALALRQIALPRNRMQAIQSLVNILLETHPEHRATAAGDTKARFAHIPEADDRRAALARLAFVARSVSGGGTYDIREARKTIRDYLADPLTLAYPPDRAQNAASELLAVNAETVGILAERAPGEIGFAHAVFEEYLAAESIAEWAFTDIVTFVSKRSSDPLWRNVISNLVSLLSRPTEVDTLVAAIENSPAAEVQREGTINRDLLLAEIAFNASRKPPATAQRLLSRAFNVIECGDWMLARREVLKAALTNIGESSAPTAVDQRLVSWTPRREQFMSGLFEALSTWQPAPDLKEALVRGLFDEERSNQRAAARTLGHLYKGDQNLRQFLTRTLQSTVEVSVAAATLEALTIGWPEAEDLGALHDFAAASNDPTLLLAGISGRLTSGRNSDSDRDSLVDLLSEFPKISYWDKLGALDLLSRCWPDDPVLVEAALRSIGLGPRRRDQLEPESAQRYLIRCSPKNPRVADWVRSELQEKYPFALGGEGLWSSVAPFANEHPDIRKGVVAYIRSESGRHSLHYFQELIPALGGDELRDFLIEVARTEEHWTEYWAVRPLLAAWGRKDRTVADFIEEIASWGDKKLNEIAALTSGIIADSNVCRARLLSLARNYERPRFDLIARGFADLGCTTDDTEVIDLLLSAVGREGPLFDPGRTIIAHFGKNHAVRKYALETLDDRSPPLATLAQVYESDEPIRSRILAFATPLPVTLRGDIAETASWEARSRPLFERTLVNYDMEVDGDLKITSSIYYHRYLSRTSAVPSPGYVKQLMSTLEAIGPDLYERRAAAFAGLVLLGRVADVAPIIEHDKPLRIAVGSSYGRNSESLLAIVCEFWDEISNAFGDSLSSRFGRYEADDGQLWDLLAPYISTSPASRRDFLSFCTDTKTTLGLRSLLALSRELPSSDLLLEHCLRIFGSNVSGRYERQSAWMLDRIRLEIAYLLRDHFADRGDVKAQVAEFARRGPKVAVVTLALLDPQNALLDQMEYTPLAIGQQMSDWVTAVHFASGRSKAEEFTNVALGMINRRRHNGIWDFQEVVNRAVVERLQVDPETVLQFRKVLAESPTTNEIASLPRYLMAAGALDDGLHAHCRSLLNEEARHPLPRAGYDALDNSIRGVALSLLEVLAPSLSS